ncbi:arginine--tRNA ligase [Candidatus Woesearchaeota archaeon]|nr:arginine--tRNA ligase [Candidatus Woesearchaeota archaeon]
MDFKEIITNKLKEELKVDSIQLSVPPNQELGDFAFPCFALSKELKKSPVEISLELAEKIIIENVTIKSEGPYLNFFVDKSLLAETVLKEIIEKKEDYGKCSDDEIVLVESPGPNTNKPLHLGHLRNILLGDSIAKILSFTGKEVHLVNTVNDRGMHICKSMLAYQKFGEGKTPESEGRKSDHFVGDFYVKYAQAAKENEELEQEVQDMLVKWENEVPEVIEIWEKMNGWALNGFSETYKKLNFEIEKEYYESETYKGGKDLIMQGLDKGVFEKDEDGSILIDLEDKKLGKKILLRSNGTSLYITQDINLVRLRYEDFKFDKMIYVVGNEQQYHFKVLFEVFKALDFKFSDKCYHFSYGMIELPEGKMKSREGNVIDTDNLIEEMIQISKLEIKSRYDNLTEEEIEDRAKKIALAAVKFSIIKYDPLKNFIFDLKKSLEFEGETGPYVLYAYVRASSILRNVDKIDYDIDFTKLDTELDRKILTQLEHFKFIVKDSASHHKPSTLAHYLLELASTFNEYYRDNQILKAEEDIKNARLVLLDSVRLVLRLGLGLLGIETLEEM